MKVLSLFDGISCGMVALERAGIKVEEYVAYEIEDSAIEVSKFNYPQIKQCGDVFKGDYTQYKGFDILIGGSPCTYWSIAKSRWGNRETTSSGFGWDLFSQYVRALKESECKYFLYENNYGMSNEIKEEITRHLKVEPILIDSKLVSAQNRKRLYWTNIPGITQPEDKGILVKDILESGQTYRDKAYCLTTSYNGAVLWNSLERSQRCMVAEVDENGTAVNENKITLTHKNKNGESITKTYKINLPDGRYVFRRYTPVEFERLQTLPDNYTQCITNPNRYKSIGNGWTVDVISHILKNIEQ